jgi:hypothetical protein
MAGASRLARLAVRPGRGRREEAMAARRRGTFLLGRRRVLPVHGEEGGCSGSRWRLSVAPAGVQIHGPVGVWILGALR